MRTVYILFSCFGLFLFRQTGVFSSGDPLPYPPALRPTVYPDIPTNPPADHSTGHPANPPAVRSTMDYFRSESAHFAASASALRTAIHQIDNKDPRTIIAARSQLAECRLFYKKIEFFLEYFFRSSSRIYNSPPRYEAEEPDMEYQSPVGMQVIEAMLFAAHPCARKKELLQQADVVAGSAGELPGFLYDFHASDQQLLESLRLELVRIITLGITGYDAPLLKSGIAESRESLRSLQYQLQPYLSAADTPASDSVSYFLEKAIALLGSARPSGPQPSGVHASGASRVHASDASGNPPHSFDHLDRMAFLTGAALPLQSYLGSFIREKGLELNTNGVLNYSAPNIFSRDALNPESFPAEADQSVQSDTRTSIGNTRHTDTAPRSNAAQTAARQAMILLGRRLFMEPALSGNGSRSCASCHSPEKYFCDRLPTPLALDGHTHLPRNAPSLLYSGFQYTQFWDGRARTLEDQIRTVLRDPREMNAGYREITARLHKTPAYDSLFRKAFPGGSGMTDVSRDIARAIAAYLRTLHPMNSPFDRYMEGDRTALSPRQINGANLFMGRAQCATCHFIPLFSGLIPPDYARTEFEVPGTTATAQFDKPAPEKDLGRYTIFPFAFYKGAFKTPTVRNVASTHPYMHNGAFPTLQKVMEFYNRGGGAGMGLDLPEQTLPSQPLHLDQKEMDDIVLFMQGLTDDNSTLNLSVTSKQ